MTATDVGRLAGIVTPAYFVGLDLGQVADYSALVVLQQSLVVEPVPPVRAGSPRPTNRYDVVHLHRWPLGTSYPTIVADVGKLLGMPALHSPGTWPRLVIDGTGVGRPVV